MQVDPGGVVGGALGFGLVLSVLAILSKLIGAGLPALLVPYPFAADAHQTANAAALVAAGAARMLDENPLGGERVAEVLSEAFEVPEQLSAMGDSAAKLARPDAATRIVEDCANRMRG